MHNNDVKTSIDIFWIKTQILFIYLYYEFKQFRGLIVLLAMLLFIIFILQLQFVTKGGSLGIYTLKNSYSSSDIYFNTRLENRGGTDHCTNLFQDSSLSLSLLVYQPPIFAY